MLRELQKKISRLWNGGKERDKIQAKIYYSATRAWLNEIQGALDRISGRLEEGRLNLEDILHLREYVLPRVGPECFPIRQITALLCLEELRSTHGDYQGLVARLRAHLDDYLTLERLGATEDELTGTLWRAHQTRYAKHLLARLRETEAYSFGKLETHRRVETELYQALADAELTIEDIGTSKVELKNLLMEVCRSTAICCDRSLTHGNAERLIPLVREALELGNLIPEEVGTTWERIAEYEKYLAKKDPPEG